MTQQDRALEYMRLHGGITSMEAFSALGIVSLPRRICDLREQGHSIHTERVSSRNRFGEKVCYNKYQIDKED